MIPPKALAAQWQSTRWNSGVQGWHSRVKPLQQDKGKCRGQAPMAAGGEGRKGHPHHVLALLSPQQPGTPWGPHCAGWGHMHAPISHPPSQC